MVALSSADLWPDHIIFTESLEYLVEEALLRSKGVWMRSRAPISESSSRVATVSSEEVEGISKDSEDDEAELWDEWVAAVKICRTFICLVPQSISRESIVTKSSTDGHFPNLTNPRSL